MIKGLNDEDRREIVKYRLEKSLRTYNEAVGSIPMAMLKQPPIDCIMLHIMQCLLCWYHSSMKHPLIMV